MRQTIEASTLYSDPEAVTLRRGERLTAVSFPVSPEGIYKGNGLFQDPGDTYFRIIGFDRSNGREFWIGRGWIVTNTKQ